MKVAALDLGSNTFLCLIAEVENEKIKHVHEDLLEVVRLGQDVEKTNLLHPEALARADNCLQKFKIAIDRHKPQKVLAMATSAARDSGNRELLFEIGKKYSIPIEIIPGNDEAKITFEGAMSGLVVAQKCLVIDIGGGSTEFIVGHAGQIQAGQSLNIGCVRLTEKFMPSQPTPESEIVNATEFIGNSLSHLKNFEAVQIDEIFAVAGTPVALVSAHIGHYDPQKIDGFVLTKKMLDDWKFLLQKSNYDQKLKLGFQAGRADVILAGVLILQQTLEKFKKKQIIVSTRGVRHGIALEIARRHTCKLFGS